MSKYRKKPISIEAVHYVGETVIMPDWIREAFKSGILFYDEDDLYVETLEGTMLVSVGDYIIKGVKGELYPCKPDIFEMTYEKEETPPTNAEYMRRCKNDEELAEAIYKCVMRHPWSFNKEVILNWLKEKHNE